LGDLSHYSESVSHPSTLEDGKEMKSDPELDHWNGPSEQSIAIAVAAFAAVDATVAVLRGRRCLPACLPACPPSSFG